MGICMGDIVMLVAAWAYVKVQLSWVCRTGLDGRLGFVRAFGFFARSPFDVRRHTLLRWTRQPTQPAIDIREYHLIYDSTISCRPNS